MWAVIPIKNLENVKTRLSPILTPSERIAFFQHMVHDVFAAVCAVPSLDGLLVVSRDKTIQSLATSYGAQLLEEPSNDGHDVAVSRAVQWLLERGKSGMMQIPGDIPTVTPTELCKILAFHAAAPTSSQTFTISPSSDYRGSNCILCSPPDLMPLKFGDDSFQHHLTRARLAGLECQIFEQPGISLDIDNPADLARLVTVPGKTRAQLYLRENAIDRRLINIKTPTVDYKEII